jgi:hypothetical protein
MRGCEIKEVRWEWMEWEGGREREGKGGGGGVAKFGGNLYFCML